MTPLLETTAAAVAINNPKRVVALGFFFFLQQQAWGLQPSSPFVQSRTTTNTNYDCSFDKRRTQKHERKSQAPPCTSGTAEATAEEATTTTTSLTMSASSSIHQDEDGNCIFGQKSYWDSMYQGKVSDDNTEYEEDLRPSDSYSWYCGWNEIKPFWEMLVSPFKDKTPGTTPKILIAGIGNDPTPIQMYDAGWGPSSCQMIAYDYSEAGITRARELFGNDRTQHVKLMVADARCLPLEDGSIDATLDKGTFDAIYITGRDIFLDSIKELTRITAKDGIVVCISRVIDPDELISAFDDIPNCWEMIHDGSLAFAPDGEATIDLGAELYSWKRI